MRLLFKVNSNLSQNLEQVIAILHHLNFNHKSGHNFQLPALNGHNKTIHISDTCTLKYIIFMKTVVRYFLQVVEVGRFLLNEPSTLCFILPCIHSYACKQVGLKVTLDLFQHVSFSFYFILSSQSICHHLTQRTRHFKTFNESLSGFVLPYLPCNKRREPV